ncbi:MAG: hypothetical protein K2X81_08915, partial [Candidatus Obscuribacterales bacterium]|nr:hypothetical protein [Candidatus Obscuribacterales bacterium]
MTKKKRKQRNERQAPPRQAGSSVQVNFDAVKEAVKHLNDADLSELSIDAIKELLQPIFHDMLLKTPVLDAGKKLYSMFVGGKPTTLDEVSGSGQIGPVNRQPNTVLYCGLSRSNAFFENKPVPTATQEVTFVEWEVKAPLPVNCVGYSTAVFQKLGTDRKWRNAPALQQTRETEFVLDYLAAKFFAGEFKELDADNASKLKMAIAEVLLAPPLGGLVFPALSVKGSSDFLAIKRDFVSSHLRFCSAELLRIDAIEGAAATTKTLNTCREINPKGELEWYIDPGRPKRYGTVGWQEFMRQKKDILSSYDSAKESSANRPVQTEHGPVAEASFRKWLSEFLPKKYAVTSGYIIPDQRVMNYVLKHYDVIVYDAINSPVLWVSNNPDQTDQGRFRAIPAKHVYAVFEVKATFNKKHVDDALKKLNELVDYQAHLPKAFSCGAVYFEVVQEEQSTCKLVEGLHANIPGYFGGLILRADGLDPNLSGSFTFAPTDVQTVPNMVLVREPGLLQRDLDGNPQLTQQGDCVVTVA